MRNFLFFFLLLGLFTQCKNTGKLTKAQREATYRFGFYNVENLFDLKNDPDRNDDDFTPDGRNKWTQERYDEKLANLSKVIKGMGLPSLLGVCEVENRTVLADLAKVDALKAADYGFVHYDSPDFRGIDVALLYKKKEFKVLDSRNIQINFPAEIVEDYTTRDILQVKGVFLGRDTLHVFVNHWPSRRGGVKESQPKRMYVAQQLRKAIDELLAVNPSATIIVMGDLNDEPINDSLIKALQTQRENEQADLYNCFMKADQEGKGSYNYRGNWNMLDHIIISAAFKQANAGLRVGQAVIFREEWMMYKDKKFGPRPSRSYGGPNYYGGYSDHLPVYVEVKAY